MPLRRKLWWISVFYFAEGFPFSIVIDNVPVYLRAHGVALADIGLLSMLGMPWTLKVLWSPLVDRFATRQQWIIACLMLIALALTFLPTASITPPGAALWGLLLVLTVASATQDVAIDAYTIGLLGPGEEGIANGVRVSAYRAALIVGGGGLVIVAGWFGWPWVFRLAALVAIVLALLVWRSPRLALPPQGDNLRSWFAPLLEWLRRPGAAVTFAFVLTYKLGDSAMGPMVKPFWVDRGLSLEEIGLISTSLGVAASVLGALCGGVLTTRWGIVRALLLLGFAQALSNLGYALVAGASLGRPFLYAASLLESFTGGLGTAAFLSFLMRICDKRHAATEYALLSAIFALTRNLAGACSGFAAAHLGYASYFGWTFVLSFPALCLLPWVSLRVAEARVPVTGENQA